VALTAEQQQQVEDALYADELADALASIARMTSEQLHSFVVHYNWDDGFAAPRAVLEQPGCERGTALHIYYALGGPFDEEQANGDHRVFLDEVKARLLSGELPERDVAYDPIADWQINKLQLLKLQRSGISDELIRPARSR